MKATVEINVDGKLETLVGELVSVYAYKAVIRVDGVDMAVNAAKCKVEHPDGQMKALPWIYPNPRQ